jgi:hypothetical protein
MKAKLTNFLLALSFMFCFNGLIEAQVSSYDYGTGSGTVNTGTGTNLSGATFFPAPTAGSVFYGFSSGANAQLSAVNPGLLRVGTNTEVQASAGNGVNEFCKFGLMGFATANTKSSYTKFEIVFGGNTGTNTSGSGTWYFFVGDGASGTQFIYNNTLVKDLNQTGVALKWDFGANGTLTNSYYSMATSAWIVLSSTITQTTKYTYEIYANLETSTTYSRDGISYSCAKNKMDIWVNNTRIANQVSVSAPFNPSGGLNKLDSWCFYGEGSNTAYIFTDVATSSGDISTITTKSYYSKSTGNLNILGTWGPNADGSGISPLNFTTDLCTYHIVNNPAPTLGAAWSVTGIDSKVELGDGTNAINFTVPQSFAFTGTLDINNNGTFTLKNTTAPTYGLLQTGSTVDYGSGASDVAYPVFYNLRFSGTGTKTLTTNITATNLITIGDGTNALSVTIPPSYTLTGITNVSNNGTLKIQNTVNPTFGTLSAGSTVEYSLSTSAQTTPVSPVIFDKLVINNSNGVSIGGSATINNTLTLTSGILNTGSQTLTFINGNTPISRTGGTITTSPGTNFVFGTAGNTGGNAFTIPSGTFTSTPTINNFTLNRTNSLSLSSDLIVGGAMTLTSGTLVLNSNALSLNGTITGSGTFFGDNSSSLNIGGTGALGTINFTNGAQILKALTINRTGSGNVILGSDLKIDGITNGTLTLTNGAFDISGKTLTFITGNTPIVRTNGTITTNSASNLIFGTPGNTGGNAFTIPAGTFTSAPTVNNFTLNRTNSLTLSQDLNVYGTLTLTSGLLIGKNGATDYVTTLGSGTSSIGTLTVGTGRIVGMFKRYLSTSTTNYIFPIGTAGNYNGVNITYPAGPTAGGTLTVNYISGDPGNMNGNNPVIDLSTNPNYTINQYSRFGYWSVINSGVTGTYQINLNADGFQGINLDSTKRGQIRIIKRENSSALWETIGNHLAATGSQQSTVAIRQGLNSFSEFALGTNYDDNTFDGSMPVSLLTINSTLSGRDIKLNWATSSELNNSGFEIERAEVKEHNSDFNKIGFVNGKGTTNTITNYIFTDYKLNAGKYRYRLKQIDNNGNFEYFNLNNNIEISAPDKFELSQNYPNPFNPGTKIDFTLPFESKTKVIVYDITGKEVKVLVNETLQSGYYTLRFEASNLSSGVYFYRIIANSNGKDFSSIKRMMVIK